MSMFLSPTVSTTFLFQISELSVVLLGLVLRPTVKSRRPILKYSFNTYGHWIAQFLAQVDRNLMNPNSFNPLYQISLRRCIVHSYLLLHNSLHILDDVQVWAAPESQVQKGDTFYFQPVFNRGCTMARCAILLEMRNVLNLDKGWKFLF